MFGRKNRRQASAGRFCRSPFELPYDLLYRYRHFTVAVASYSFWRTWPSHDITYDGPVAHGVLHGGRSYPEVDEPSLPVEVRFYTRKPFSAAFGVAHFNRSSMDADATYLLHVDIADPTGAIAAEFQAAMSRAISSGHSFKHLHCFPRRDAVESDQAEWDEQRSALLSRVDAGEASLPNIDLDRIQFEDDLTTNAPAWAWAWKDWNFDRFQNPKVARWRTEDLPLRKK